MNVYVFPGQGSQKKGMEEGRFSRFKHYTRLADDVLGYSIETLCIEDLQNQLGQTQYTQPALYVVELSYLRALQEKPNPPESVAGHSLGEYLVPVMSNVHARPYAERAVAQHLTERICAAVRWVQTILFLLAKGDVKFEELGPGRVLTNLISAVRRETAAGANV